MFQHMAFIGPESEWAAEATECANEQGKFWEYHDKLFDNQGGENVGAFSKANLKRFAAEMKLDTAAFNVCLDSDKYLAKVRADTAQSSSHRHGPGVPECRGPCRRHGQEWRLHRRPVRAGLRLPPPV